MKLCNLNITSSQVSVFGALARSGAEFAIAEHARCTRESRPDVEMLDILAHYLPQEGTVIKALFIATQDLRTNL